MDNPVKRTLSGGGAALGTMVFEFTTPGIARITANAGAEFVIFDSEHTRLGIDTLGMLLASARGTGLVPMVRVPETESHLLSRPLDVGALGLMVPMVETEEQARRIVRYAKYPPVGERGAAFGLAHDDYLDSVPAEQMRRANDATLLIAQIETLQGAANAERIAAVDGIDVLWIGHGDLSINMGIPGQFDHPDFVAAVDSVLAACAATGKAAGYRAGSEQEAIDLRARGFRALAYANDVRLYGGALRDALTRIRAHDPADTGTAP